MQMMDHLLRRKLPQERECELASRDHSVLIVVSIITGAEPTGLRIHYNFAVLPILGCNGFEISTVADDLYI